MILKKQNDLKYKWLEYSQSFLLLAKLACQELEDKRKIKHNKITRFDPPNFYFPYSEHDLFVAIVFNIKHGVEVFIKTVSVILDGNSDRGHDIKSLFKKLKRKILSRKNIYSDGKGNNITQEDVDDFPTNLDDLEKIIMQYYHCDFLIDTKVLNICDRNNDIFRYPDNKTNIDINLNFINEDIIKKIHEDIDNVYRLFNDIGYLIDVCCNKSKRE